MNSSQPASSPRPAPGLGSGRPIEPEASNGSPAGLPPTPGRLLAIAAGAGLLAGGLSWLIGESVLNAFRPPIEEQHVMGQVIMKASFHDQSAADFKNATLAFAVLGGVLGATLGLAGGLARNSTRAAAMAAAIGLILGVVMGIGTSSAFLPLFFRALDVSKEELSRDLTLPLLVHCGIWSACGLAGGLAFGIGLGGPRRTRHQCDDRRPDRGGVRGGPLRVDRGGGLPGRQDGVPPGDHLERPPPRAAGRRDTLGDVCRRGHQHARPATRGQPAGPLIRADAMGRGDVGVGRDELPSRPTRPGPEGQYASELITSPPLRVPSDIQVNWLTLLLMNLTLPSQNRTLAPPGWALAAPTVQAPLGQASLVEPLMQPPTGYLESLGTWTVLNDAKPMAPSDQRHPL